MHSYVRSGEISTLPNNAIVIGFYNMISGFMRTLQIPIDAQTDGEWIKK
jgi:hypothetical protein